MPTNNLQPGKKQLKSLQNLPLPFMLLYMLISMLVSLYDHKNICLVEFFNLPFLIIILIIILIKRTENNLAPLNE